MVILGNKANCAVCGREIRLPEEPTIYRSCVPEGHRLRYMFDRITCRQCFEADPNHVAVEKLDLMARKIRESLVFPVLARPYTKDEFIAWMERTDEILREAFAGWPPPDFD